MSADRFSLPSRVSADRSPTRRDALKSGAALAVASVVAPLGVPGFGLFSNAFAATIVCSTANGSSSVMPNTELDDNVP